MEQFGAGDNVVSRVAQGRWTTLALRRVRQRELSYGMGAATRALREQVRHREDVEDDVNAAIDRRGEVSRALTDTARLLRIRLTDSLDAQWQAPYVDIPPKGTKEFTKISIGDTTQRFTDLRVRLEATLREGHPVRREIAPMLHSGLAEWELALTAVVAARSELDRASARVWEGVRDWDHAWCQVYGKLWLKVGRKEADRCFVRGGPSPASAAGDRVKAWVATPGSGIDGADGPAPLAPSHRRTGLG